MTSKLQKIKLPARPSYGAVELKMQIEKNTYRAFIALMGMGALIFFASLFVGSSINASAKEFFAPPPPLEITPIDLSIEEDDIIPLLPPPPPEVQLEGLVDEIAGKIETKPADEVPEDAPVFVDLEDMDKATECTVDVEIEEKFTLDGPENNNEPLAVVEVVEVETEPIPPPDTFIVYEVKAQINMDELKASIEYPVMAKENGIEGTVYVLVWIDKFGNPHHAEVAKTDSKMLSQAALDAVKKIKAVPAIQNGHNVGMWVTIPITFKLSR